MVQVLHPELSEPQLAGSRFRGKQLNVFVLWHLLVARGMTGRTLGYKNPRPDLIRCSYTSKTRLKIPTLHPKTRNTWELLSLGKLDYVPNQVNQQSGWDCPALSLQAGAHTGASWAKGKSQVTSLWAAGLPYGDLLCPLVTIKHKTRNFAPSIPINKNQVLLHLLAGRQAVGLFFLWPNWEYPLPEAAWSPLSGEACGMEQRKEMLFWKVENRHPKLGNECPSEL